MDLNAVAAEIRACRACPLHRSSRQAVPGDGTGESALFFLGEAPGYHEDVQGKPFVGAKFFPGESISRIHGKPRLKDGLVIFPVYHPAAALHQPALRDALFADFAALALYLARPPAPKPEAEEAKRPAEQITLFG